MKERKGASQFERITRHLGRGIEVREKDLGEFDGLINYSRGDLDAPTILIHKELEEDEKVHVLIHEMYHHSYPGVAEDLIEIESTKLFKSLNKEQLGTLRAFLAAFRKH